MTNQWQGGFQGEVKVTAGSAAGWSAGCCRRPSPPSRWP
ncbi:hypothetical protein ACSNN9_21825 [Micromonospora sp. URMC 107]